MSRRTLMFALALSVGVTTLGAESEEVTETDALPEISEVQTPLLISDKTSPEAGMLGIIQEPDRVTFAKGKSESVSDTSAESLREEESEALPEKKKTRGKKSFSGLMPWHEMWRNIAPPPRVSHIRIVPKKKVPETSEEETETTTEEKETFVVAESYAPNLRAVTFLSASMRSASTSYAVSALADTDAGTTVEIPEGAMYYDGGETSIQGITQKYYYNWCAEDWRLIWTTYNSTLGSNTDYENDGSVDVVFAEYYTAEDGTSTKVDGEVVIMGTVTPNSIIIESGDYTLTPKATSVLDSNIDGQIGGDASLIVCEGASLTLTDDNSYTGDTIIYGTVNLDVTAVFPDADGNLTTGKLGTGDVYVYGTPDDGDASNDGSLFIGTSHLNNSSLNIEGGTVTLGAPYIDETTNELVSHTLLKDVEGNHNEGAVIRLGVEGTGGTLDLTGSWANGHYELYSGTLTSTNTTTPHSHYDEDGNLITDECYSGQISGKIEINIAAGDTLEIENIKFTRDLDSVEEHTHTATIENGGQLVLSGTTDMRLHSLTLDLGAFDSDEATTPILFENYEGTNLSVAELNINIDDATLEDLINNSENGQLAYKAISIVDSNGNVLEDATVSEYVTAEFTSVKVNDGSKWTATVDPATGQIFIMAIPEPAAFALIFSVAAATFAGTRRRRKSAQA